MLEFVNGSGNIAWHRQDDCSVDVVPFDCNVTVEFADPISSNAVVFSDAIAEMISVLLADILYAKSVHQYRENVTGGHLWRQRPGVWRHW